jgi:hypothetical protein
VIFVSSKTFVFLPYITRLRANKRISRRSSRCCALLRILYAFSARTSAGATERKCRYE